MWLAQILRGPDFPCDDSQAINKVKLRSPFIVSFCLYSLPSGAPTPTRHLSWRLDLVLLSTVGPITLPARSVQKFLYQQWQSVIYLATEIPIVFEDFFLPFSRLVFLCFSRWFHSHFTPPISQLFSCVLLHNCTTICCISTVYLFHSNTRYFGCSTAIIIPDIGHPRQGIRKNVVKRSLLKKCRQEEFVEIWHRIM